MIISPSPVSITQSPVDLKARDRQTNISAHLLRLLHHKAGARLICSSYTTLPETNQLASIMAGNLLDAATGL